MMSPDERVNDYLKELRQDIDDLRQKVAKNQIEKGSGGAANRSRHFSKGVINTEKP